MDERLQEQELDAPVTVVIGGHVDHGKSSLLGRLLFELGGIADDKVTAARRYCDERGLPFEYAFLLDALHHERERAITIDAARVTLRAGGRSYRFFDAPGHRELQRNLATGASNADIGVVVIDITVGVTELVREQLHIFRLLGVPRLIVALNKIDLVSRPEEAARALEQEVKQLTAEHGYGDSVILPVSAQSGVNVTSALRPDWWNGASLDESLFSCAQQVTKQNDRAVFWVQDCLGDYLLGTVSGGTFVPAQEVIVCNGEQMEVRRIEKILQTTITPVTSHMVELDRTSAGEAVAVLLAGGSGGLKRGAVITEPPLANPTRSFVADIFWCGEADWGVNEVRTLRIGTREEEGVLKGSFQRLAVSRVEIETMRALWVDQSSAALSQFVVLDHGVIAAFGRIRQ